jgi:hypothetical protein
MLGALLGDLAARAPPEDEAERRGNHAAAERIDVGASMPNKCRSGSGFFGETSPDCRGRTCGVHNHRQIIFKDLRGYAQLAISQFARSAWRLA